MSPKRAGSETSFQNGEEEEEAEKADEKSEVPFMPEFEEPQRFNISCLSFPDISSFTWNNLQFHTSYLIPV